MRRTIARYRLLAPGRRVLVAVSGGPDSVALLELLRDLEAAGELTVAGVAHFNHRLRGDAADADEAFVRDMAERLRLPFEVGRADVREMAARRKRSIEDTARSCRYAFLHEAADRLGADVIAVGHSLDDQAETFLLRLLRGAGTRGLGGIRPRAGRVIRPLLEMTRAQLRQFAADRCLTYREDETNADVRIPRNRVRLELLPYLERHFGGNVAAVLAREAALAQVDADRLETEAIELAASVVLVDTAGRTDEIVLDVAALAAAHPALASRVARRALELRAGERFIGADHVARLLEFVRGAGAGAALSLPGQQAVHRGGTVVLRPEPPRAEPTETPGFRMALPLPGEVRLEGPGLIVSAGPAEADTLPVAELGCALVRGLETPFAVRSRRPGDRFQPPGLGGRSKKLQDYLVDRKVPRAERDLVPLVVDRHDRIVWVVGHGISEAYRAGGPGPGVILLKVRRLGGEG